FLLREIRFGEDGDFSEGAFIKRLNSDLANDLGNFVYRTLTMIEKYFNGHIPAAVIADGRWKQKLDKFSDEVNLHMSNLDFNLALDKIWELINMANKYIEDTKPWNLVKKENIDALQQFICILVDAIRKISHAISPFMPQTAKSILEQIGKDVIRKGKPLFPRIDILKSEN
ncbi:MAG: class I tRNA ligase family protein, partial [Candidatus Omnitrophica bacterium]|nr:class I tRNA ligase family protein [Candidatus Omnitrophota bacterium]